MALDPILVLLLYVIGIPLAFMFFLIFMDMLTLRKASVLYLESEQIGKLRKAKVKDGAIKFKQKIIHVDKIKPLMINAGFFIKGRVPFYVIKHDIALPLYFSKGGIKVMTGENLRKLIENKTLEKLLTPKDSNKGIFLYMIFGLVVGGILGYLLAGGHIGT